MKAFTVFLVIAAFFLTSGISHAATYTVTNLNNSGGGSLRWAIQQANVYSGPDTIDFSVSGTISPSSALPAMTDDGTVIDASSQWFGTWPGGQPGITLDGTSAGSEPGIEIRDANNCHIRGLFIANFETHGIRINSGAHFNTIGGTGEGYRNVISGNDSYGVFIVGSSVSNNVVSGNYIGTDVTGTSWSCIDK